VVASGSPRRCLNIGATRADEKILTMAHRAGKTARGNTETPRAAGQSLPTLERFRRRKPFYRDRTFVSNWAHRHVFAETRNIQCAVSL
jgi:hypothetical protein